MSARHRHHTFRPPADAWRGPVALSPDGRHIAFRVERLERIYDVCVAPVDGDGHAVVLRGSREASPFDLRWSPGSDRLAYLASGDRRRRSAGCVSLAGDRPAIGPRAGSAYDWAPDGRALFVFDASSGALSELDDWGEREVARFIDDGNPALPASLTVDPSGRRIAVVCHDENEDRASIWIAQRSGNTAPALLTDVPGFEARAAPVWCPAGDTLALHIVHPYHRRSALMLMPELASGGDMLFVHDAIDEAEAPAWSPSGRAIAFFRTPSETMPGSGSGPAALTLLDVDSRDWVTLRDAAGIAGRCHFLNAATLAIDAHDGAHTFTFESSL